MSEVLNYYLEKYGVIEPQSETISIETNENARKRWDHLKKNITSISNLVEQIELRDTKISHGIQFIRRINHVNEIQQALYISSMNTYLTLDGCSIRMFDSSGRYKSFISYSDIDANFQRLAYASCSNRFISWIPNCEELSMLGSGFELIEKIDPSLINGPIIELFYNEDKNEIISAHFHKLILWQFRYANKHLVPRKTIALDCNQNYSNIFSLERTQRKVQHLFLVCECSITVIELSKAVFVSNFKSLHERRITALTFFNPLKFLVSGCKDGSIKVWSFSDDDLKLKMVFVGHSRSVTSLGFFPGGFQATVASCGYDKTLRVWSLDIDDEVQCLDLDYSSTMIGSEIAKSSFFTLSKNFMDIWHQNHIYDDLMTLNSLVVNIKMNVGNAEKVLVTCQNNLVFFLQSTGEYEIITKTVIGCQDNSNQSSNKVISIVYLEAENILIVLVQDNRILKYGTLTHPMILENLYQCSLDNSMILLAAYTQTTEVVNSKSRNTSLIFSGSNMGWIRVHDLNQLEKITFQIKAHSDVAIVSMLSDSSNNKFFTSGMDNTIKVWHVYPYATEPLSKILSFFCGLLPSQLVNVNHYLFTVFCDSECGQYPSVVYNIKNSERYDHSPDNDHVEPVNSVSACPRMKLFLSCSSGIENVIKIWTCKNVLLRQIEINFPIHYAIFSSERADIFAAIGHQICFIRHTKYLPKSYIKKLVMKDFESVTYDTDVPIEFNNELCQNKFGLQDITKMEGIKPVFRYQSYADILSKEELQEIETANLLKKTNFDRIKATEKDILKIQQGYHEKPHKRYEKYMEMPPINDAFDVYFSHIVKYSKIYLPGEDKEENNVLKNKLAEKYKKNAKVGFFPSRETMNLDTAPVIFKKGGYIPNSIILQSLWPSKVIQEKSGISKPLLTSLDFKMQHLLKKSDVENNNLEENIFDWEFDEDSEKVLRSPTPPIDNVDEKLSDDLIDKFGISMEDREMSEKQTEEFIDMVGTIAGETETSKESMSRSLSTTFTKTNMKLPKISRTPKTMPEIRKVKFKSSTNSSFVSDEQKDLDIFDKDQSSSNSSLFLTQVPYQESIVSKDMSYLPVFLSPFIHENWFIRICPPPYNEKGCLKHLPSPLNSKSFIIHVLQMVESTDDDQEVLGMTNAISSLYSDDILERKNLTNINSVIENKLKKLIKLDNETRINLFKSCLRLMASLEGVSDKVLVTICLSRYFDADFELKRFLKSILFDKGLEDNTGVLDTELSSFKLFSVRPGDERLNDLIKIISDWLEKWFQSMISFVTECRRIVEKEVHLFGDSYQKLSPVTKEYLEKVKNIFHYNISSSEDLLLFDTVDRGPRSVLTYINCLNYFRFKRLSEDQRNNKEEISAPKKTIVCLPKLSSNKQCLVRLGESNADSIVAKSKKDFIYMNTSCMRNIITDHTQHASMQPFSHYQTALGGGFVPFLHLHLKPCIVNPFPIMEDYIEWQNANPRSIFRSSHRVFIPQFSLPPEPF